jgi:hypothetical protein
MENFKNKTLERVSKELSWTDEAIQKFTSLESLPEPLDCKPGCHYCCYNLAMVTPPEALLIGYHAEQNFSNQKIKKISDRVNKVFERINGISPYEIPMMRHELPCIFLEDGTCMVY